MTSPHREEEIRRREREIQAREHALRLRELEAELNEPPLHHPIRHRPSGQPLQRWGRQLKAVVTFLAIVVGVAVALRVAAWLARLLVVGAIAWVVYKMFFEDDRRR